MSIEKSDTLNSQTAASEIIEDAIEYIEEIQQDSVENDTIEPDQSNSHVSEKNEAPEIVDQTPGESSPQADISKDCSLYKRGSELEAMKEDIDIGSYVSKSNKEKANIFFDLTEFEQQRCLRIKDLHALCDPVAEQIEVQLNQIKFMTSQTCKFMREKVKEFHEMAQRCKASNTSLKLNKICANTNGSQEDENPTNPTEAQNITAGQPKTGAGLQSRNVNIMIDWLKRLNAFSDTEAAAYEESADVVETRILYGLTNDNVSELQKSVAAALVKVQERRSRIEKCHKETIKYWADLDKHYRQQLEKLSEAQNDPSLPNTPNKFDIWLYERKYLTAATVLHKQCSVYNQCFIEVIDILKQFQDQRGQKVRQAIVDYISSIRTRLSCSAMSLGNLHSHIDPLGFDEARKEFLNKQPSPKTDLPSESKGKEDTAGGVSSSPAPPIKETTESPDSTEVEFFESFKWIISATAPPQSHFIVKKGFVKRQSYMNGIFPKWSDGLLVFTWDLFLHMFRSHDDPGPLWSVYIPSIEFRTIEEKNQKSLELMEKKNFLSLLGRQNLIFQPRTVLDLQSWISVLQMASSGPNDGFRDVTNMIVKTVDDEEMQRYAQQQQEI